MDGDDGYDSRLDTHAQRYAIYHRSSQASPRDGAEPELARKSGSIAMSSLPRRASPLRHRWYFGGEDENDDAVLNNENRDISQRAHRSRRLGIHIFHLPVSVRDAARVSGFV